jgi:hypothetical protein
MLIFLLATGCSLEGSTSSEACTKIQWYMDADGDGYGDANTSTMACAPPAHTVTNADDCNDQDKHLTMISTWYIDADGDGYGSTRSITACAAPTGATKNETDYDDNNADVWLAPDEWPGDLDTDFSNFCEGYGARIYRRQHQTIWPH